MSLPDSKPCLEQTIQYLRDRLRQTNAALETGEPVDQESMAAVRELLALSMQLYVSNYHAGSDAPIFPPGHGVSATDVMVTSTQMLKAVNVQLFELGMFQSWSSA